MARLRRWAVLLVTSSLVTFAPLLASGAGAAGKGKGGVPAGTPEQGITKTSIKIGVAPVTLGEVKTLNHYKSLLDRWHEDGTLPINGRDIEFVYHELTVSGDPAPSNREACLEFADEEKVAMALGNAAFVLGAECLAKEKKIVTLGSAGAIPSDDTLNGARPFMFYTNMSTSRVLRNWPHWAQERKHLKGKKLALVSTDTPVVQTDISRNFKPQLAKLGYKLTEDVLLTDATSIPGAVQRLKSSGVEVVFLAASGQVAPFAQEIDKQGYDPLVLMSEFEATTATASIPRDLPDGFRAEAMAAYHRAEDGVLANPAGPPAQTECADNFAEQTGKTLIESVNGVPGADYAEFHLLMHVCDQGNILLAALRAAGKNLTTASLIKGIESVKGIQSGEVADISFSKANHSGAAQIKTISWEASCDCWQQTTTLKDAYVK